MLFCCWPVHLFSYNLRTLIVFNGRATEKYQLSVCVFCTSNRSFYPSASIYYNISSSIFSTYLCRILDTISIIDDINLLLYCTVPGS